MPARSSKRSSRLRRLAWAAVVAGVVLPPARKRLKVPPVVTAATVVAAPLGLVLATPRSRRRDVGVYALQLWAFIILHELPYDRPQAHERRVRVDYPIACDRVLGLGVTPTVRLQRALSRPEPRTLDYVLACVHWAWFLQPHGVAAWVLWRSPERFPRAAASMSSLFHLGALIYVIVPTAPPWWAAEAGRLENCRRVMVEVGERFWGEYWVPLYDFLGGNPVAAMPSLHFSSSVMAAHVLSEEGPVEAAVGWAYVGALGFGLVYLGEHYVIDLLAGLGLAEAVRRLAPHAGPALAPALRAVAALEKKARSA